MWPEGFKNSEKLSLVKGSLVQINTGPNYDIPETGEFKVQGKEKLLSKVMTQVSSLKRGGHNASQIDCDNLLKQFSCNDEAEEVNTQANACKKMCPKTRKDIEIPVASSNEDDYADNDDNDLPDMPEINHIVDHYLNQCENNPTGQNPPQHNSQEVIF